MSSPPAAGIYPPIPTFFKADRWTLDLETQKKHTQFLIDNGIKGVTVCGSTGENSHLTRDERSQLVKLVREVGGKDFVVIAGVAQNSADEAIKDIVALKEAGANFALTVTSNYFGGAITQDGIYSWFKRVADAAPLPVMVYLFPGISNGLVIKDTTFEKLAQHDNIVGAKFTYTDCTLFAQVGLNPKVQAAKFEIFPGYANFLLPAFTVGCGGLIDGMANVFPKSIAKLLDYGLKRDFGEDALKLQYLVSKGEQIACDGGIPATKSLIKHFTGLGETLSGRAPLDKDFPTEIFTASLSDVEPLALFEKSL